METSAHPESVSQWGRWQGAFTSSGPASPESDLKVELTSPTGRKAVVDGFWDGGNTWRARFMPDEPGKWAFNTISADSGLNGKSGQFDCGKAKSKHAIFKNGPVRISKNGRHLAHADATPFFWMGDTAWNGPLLASKADWEIYLKDRAAKRFSVIQFVLTAPWRTAPTDELSQVAFTGKEKVQVNPKFFQRMDERVDAINEKGLVAAPVLLWAISGDENPGHSLPEDQIIKLEKYMVARYSAHHVVWIPGGDADYSGANGEKWRRIGRAVFGENKRAPVVLHPGGMAWPWDDYKSETWLDVAGYQSGHGDDGPTLAWIHSGPPAKKWRDKPSRPMINLELPYEDHVAYQSKQPHTDRSVRRAAYWSLLNTPTAGITYGAHGIWSWEKSTGEPLNHKGTGIAKPWQVAMKLPGSVQMGHLAKVFTGMPWWLLSPAQELLMKQPGADDPSKFVSAAQTEDGNFAVLYLPVGGDVDIKAAKFLDGYRAYWVDPRSGGQIRAFIAGSTTFHAPNTDDWLLVIGRW